MIQGGVSRKKNTVNKSNKILSKYSEMQLGCNKKACLSSISVYPPPLINLYLFQLCIPKFV